MGKLFNKAKAYLVRINNGILHLKEYARKMSLGETKLNETINRGAIEAEQRRKELDRLNKKENQTYKTWGSGGGEFRIYLNTSFSIGLGL